jgi:predicted nucleic acid-binding Zn ribbon protein
MSWTDDDLIGLRIKGTPSDRNRKGNMARRGPPAQPQRQDLRVSPNQAIPTAAGKGWSLGKEFVDRRACEQCGEAFYAPPSLRARGGGRFCSKQCRGAHTKALTVKNATCSHCGTEFHRPPSHVPVGDVFCGKQCQQAMGVERQRAARRHCLRCGSEFQPKAAQKFCSVKCRPPSIPAAPKPLTTCSACGLMFSPSGGSTGKYCSMACVGRSRVGPRSAGEIYSSTRGGRRDDLAGRYFRSAWEANWARYLNWLVRHGAIASWQFEATTFEFHKIKRGSRFYTPDFRVTNNDASIEYHEIKGYMDPRSATKLRRMAKYYPGVKIVLIEKSAYAAVAKKIAALIPEWEHGTLRRSKGAA